jgi:hypothetical protein
MQPGTAAAFPDTLARSATAAPAPSSVVAAAPVPVPAPTALRFAAIPIPEPPRPAVATVQAPARSAPGLLLIARSGETLSSLYAKVYRGLVPPPFEAVAAANPKQFKPGDVLVFPSPPEGWKPERIAGQGAT